MVKIRKEIKKSGQDTPNVALLVIDMQTALVEAAHRRGKVLNKVGALLERARAADAPVIYTQHDHDSYEPMKPGAEGWTIQEEIAPLADDIVIRKRSSDSFHETALAGELRARGVERIVVTGMASEYCVDTTSRSALSHGFAVTLVEDAHTTVCPAAGPLSPEQIIAHHNETLGRLEHPGRSIAVVPESEIAFTSRG